MEMGELANCPKCNGLFVKSQFRDICDACYKEEEKAFETVYNYLKKRENRKATLIEVSEATEVSEDLILKFIRQGRLQLANYPNLGYPCERCGTMIREGKLCLECSRDIKREIEKMKMYENSQDHLELRHTTYYVNQPKNKK